MMPDLLDIVRTRHADPSAGVAVGDEGVVVYLYRGGTHAAVEFDRGPDADPALADLPLADLDVTRSAAVR